jgi:hypothetical protein
MGRYLAARMRLGAATGDTATVIECFEHALAIARVLAFRPFMIERTVGVGIAQEAMAEARLYAGTGSLSADDARRMLAIMDRQLAWPGVALQIEGSRLMALDLVQQTHSAGGLIPGRLLYAHYESMISGGAPDQGFTAIRNVAGLVMPSRAETVRTVDAMHDGMLTSVGLNPRQRAEHGFDLPVFVGSLPARQVLVRQVSDAGVEPLLLAHDVHEALAGLTRLRLALLMHQQTRGSYPESLAALAPAFIPELPRDPFADDGSFVYRTDGTGFVLWSVGWDGVDNGGAEGEGTQAFERTHEGTDFVVRVGG